MYPIARPGLLSWGAGGLPPDRPASGRGCLWIEKWTARSRVVCETGDGRPRPNRDAHRALEADCLPCRIGRAGRERDRTALADGVNSLIARPETPGRNPPGLARTAGSIPPAEVPRGAPRSPFGIKKAAGRAVAPPGAHLSAPPRAGRSSGSPPPRPARTSAQAPAPLPLPAHAANRLPGRRAGPGAGRLCEPGGRKAEEAGSRPWRRSGAGMLCPVLSSGSLRGSPGPANSAPRPDLEDSPGPLRSARRPSSAPPLRRPYGLAGCGWGLPPGRKPSCAWFWSPFARPPETKTRRGCAPASARPPACRSRGLGRVPRKTEEPTSSKTHWSRRHRRRSEPRRRHSPGKIAARGKAI